MIAKDAAAYRGKQVRTCGTDFLPHRDGEAWQLSVPYAEGRHSASVHVIGCQGRPPHRDSEGCITGRVARSDGSLTVPPVLDIVVRSAPDSLPWYIHEQCPARGN